MRYRRTTILFSAISILSILGVLYMSNKNANQATHHFSLTGEHFAASRVEMHLGTDVFKKFNETKETVHQARVTTEKFSVGFASVKTAVNSFKDGGAAVSAIQNFFGITKAAHFATGTTAETNTGFTATFKSVDDTQAELKKELEEADVKFQAGAKIADSGASSNKTSIEIIAMFMQGQEDPEDKGFFTKLWEMIKNFFGFGPKSESSTNNNSTSTTTATTTTKASHKQTTGTGAAATGTTTAAAEACVEPWYRKLLGWLIGYKCAAKAAPAKPTATTGTATKTTGTTTAAPASHKQTTGTGAAATGTATTAATGTTTAAAEACVEPWYRKLLGWLIGYKCAAKAAPAKPTATTGTATKTTGTTTAAPASHKQTTGTATTAATGTTTAAAEACVEPWYRKLLGWLIGYKCAVKAAPAKPTATTGTATKTSGTSSVVARILQTTGTATTTATGTATTAATGTTTAAAEACVEPWYRKLLGWLIGYKCAVKAAPAKPTATTGTATKTTGTTTAAPASHKQTTGTGAAATGTTTAAAEACVEPWYRKLLGWLIGYKCAAKAAPAKPTATTGTTTKTSGTTTATTGTAAHFKRNYYFLTFRPFRSP